LNRAKITEQGLDLLLDKLYTYKKEKERDKKLIKELRILLKMQSKRITALEKVMKGLPDKVIEEFGLTEHLKSHTYS